MIEYRKARRSRQSLRQGFRWCLPMLVLLAGAEAAARPRASEQTASPTRIEAAGLAQEPGQRHAFFGDLHLHTTASFDAAMGKADVGPDGAYRFARGLPVKVQGRTIRRTSRPLDFVAVTDHAEYLGVRPAVERGAVRGASGLAARLKANFLEVFAAIGWPLNPRGIPEIDTDSLSAAAWRENIAAANRNYIPGRFTTFIAYEWTSQPGAADLHRNVIFSGDTAPRPFSAMDSVEPEALWDYLDRVRATGVQAIAIPHNSNRSYGRKFEAPQRAAADFAAYSARRAANEGLVEIVQNKGQSETHPLLSPHDPEAGFEVLDLPDSSSNGNLVGSYARDALGRGLEYAASGGGANPFRFGFVGASDFHNGLSDSAERAYNGVFGAYDPREGRPDARRQLEEIGLSGEALERNLQSLQSYSSAGLTGAWAEANTRPALFAAFLRKETFATSGTRLKVRLFGGWGAPSAGFNGAWASQAYRWGAPMGGELPPAPVDSGAPYFLVWAQKDPDGAGLHSAQIIKLSLRNGRYYERIHQVASPGQNDCGESCHRAEPARGHEVLSAVWRDPEFDPAAPALYYLRVLEVPSWRWNALAAPQIGRQGPRGAPMTIQERAWSSPVWYAPPPPTSATEETSQ